MNVNLTLTLPRTLTITVTLTLVKTSASALHFEALANRVEHYIASTLTLTADC